MAAEGKPGNEPFLAGPLGLLARFAVRYPLLVVVVCASFALAAILLTATMLGFRTSRLDLLNPNSGYNQLWLQYIEEFGEEDDVVIVVEGESREEIVPVLEQLTAAVGREPALFHSVLNYNEVDLGKIRSKALHHLSREQLAGVQRFIDHHEAVLRDDWSQLGLGAFTARLNLGLRQGPAEDGSGYRAAARRQLTALAESLAAWLEKPQEYRSLWPEFSDRFAQLRRLESEYVLADDSKLGFILLRLVGGKDTFAQGSEAIDRLRQLIRQTERKYPQAEIGVTGLPVMENDEMRASQHDMLVAGLVSLGGVLCLFVAGFGGIRHPVLTVCALLFAMAWAFGYVTIGVGHLNILSVSFAVILIGLGVDFGIHYLAGYLQHREKISDSGEALVTTSRRIGPGIVAGGITTALAFFTAQLTEFTGIAELGLIAAGGIVLCIIAAVLLLPALIQLMDRDSTRPMPVPIEVNRWVNPLFRFPKMVLLVMLAGTAMLAIGATRVWYDHNLLNLQPRGVESVELEKKLFTETDTSVWYALSIAETREELLERKRQFLALPIVDRTEEIVSMLPPEDAERTRAIARIAARLEALPERPPHIPVVSPDALGSRLSVGQSLLEPAIPAERRLALLLDRIRDHLRQMPASECYKRLSQFQSHMAGDLLSRLHELRSMANPEPPSADDLPGSLVTRFVGKTNRHLLKIYSRGDIWDMAALRRFVDKVKQIDPAATGKPLQTFYASLQMQWSYICAAIYSLIAVTIVLVFDLRSIRDSLLALIPVALGMLQLFGILGFLDVPLNPANMIVLPLILGIGIDDGVHVVHDWRRQSPARYKLSSSTATAVLITSATTMVGFGSLMLAHHRGLESLGRTLTIGVACCMVTSMIVLPAILTWISRYTSPGDKVEDGPQDGSLTKQRRTHIRRVAEPELVS